MEFKIDTKPTYITITSDAKVLDANLAGAIDTKCRELSGNGSPNFIIDLSECREVDASALTTLLELHETCYTNEQSLVFAGLPVAIRKRLEDDEVALQLNIAPTFIEAVDIISMEILERDLFKEE